MIHSIICFVLYSVLIMFCLGLSQTLCKVQTRVKHSSCWERFCSLLFQYNRNKAKNQALIRQPVSEKYLKLGVNNTPITPFSCPLLGDVHHRQIQHFQQTVIGRKHGFRFGNLAQLAVETLYGVGGINQCPNLLRILKICG